MNLDRLVDAWSWVLIKLTVQKRYSEVILPKKAMNSSDNNRRVLKRMKATVLSLTLFVYYKPLGTWKGWVRTLSDHQKKSIWWIAPDLSAILKSSKFKVGPDCQIRPAPMIMFVSEVWFSRNKKSRTLSNAISHKYGSWYAIKSYQIGHIFPAMTFLRAQFGLECS